ncbi:MAG: YdcF family protein [Pseudomonadota bacterium]
MTTWIIRLIALVILSGGLSLLGVAIYVYTYAPPDTIPRARAIIVVSGPGGNIPGTDWETRERVDKGIELFNRNLAPYLVMSGGGGLPDGLSHARYMADYAISQGVPERLIFLEPNSGSTLQNAWFSKKLEQVDPELPMIVVSHRYHLPRVWASFRWAGYQKTHLIAADSGAPEIHSFFLAEAIKWPFNLFRSTVAWIAMAVGVPEDTVLPWLR